jgi:hypothetical protein
VSPTAASHLCGATSVDWSEWLSMIRPIDAPSGSDLGRARDACIPLSATKLLTSL